MVNRASKEQKKVLKHKCWGLLKSQRNHTERDKKSLEQLKTLNLPLYEAYLLKQELDLFLRCENVKQGKRFLRNWFKQIPETIKEFFQPFYKMIRHYLHGVLSFFQHRYTNCVAEGTNNKIKVLKRMAYGYRDKGYSQSRILKMWLFEKDSTRLLTRTIYGMLCQNREKNRKGKQLSPKNDQGSCAAPGNRGLTKEEEGKFAIRDRGVLALASIFRDE